MAKRRKLNHNPDHGKGLLKRLADNSPTGPGEQPTLVHLMNFEVTWDVMPDPEVDALPEATRDRMEQIFDLVHRDPKSVVQELRSMVALYPDVPCLTNWLIHVLREGSVDECSEGLKLCTELFRRMPEYFFARTTLADMLLDLGKAEEAAELLFEQSGVLSRLYPGRKIFHISEIRHWCYLCARTKIFLGEPDAAKGYRNILDQLEPDSPPIHHLDEMLEGEEAIITRLLADFKKLS